MDTYDEVEDYDDYESCSYCGGGHQTDEHDMSPEEAGIAHNDWGPLYHGTPFRVEGGVIAPEHFNSHAMPGASGTFATTSRVLAEKYARPNAHTERVARETGRTIDPAVHVVEPHPEDHGPFSYQIDPNSGSSGWQDAPHIRDLHELNSYGEDEHSESGTSLMFPGRLLSKQQFRID